MTKEAMKLALEALKQIDEAMPFPVAKLAQAALREALAEQPAQLPFGVGGGLVAIKTLLSRDPCVHSNTAIQMIDAILTEHPAQRKPLTDEQIIASNYPDGEENGPTITAPDFELICFARQIEAAHNIKEKNT